jgi:hypothetical protein
VSEGTASRWGTLPWLLAGMVAGAAATIALVVLAVDFFRGSAPTNALGPPRFVEETDSSGIAHVYDGDFEYFVGGGVAVFDCNDDDRPDLYFAGGTNPAGLYRNASEAGGRLRFDRVDEPAVQVSNVTGAYPLDVDSDGLTDLALLRVGTNVMLRGIGECGFEVADNWGVDGGDQWTVSFSATWEEGESLPTMVFGNYLDLDSENRSCAEHHLFRPRGGAYGTPTTLTPGYCTLSVLFSDWSRSGRRDLRMTNDRHYYRNGGEQLWRMEPGEPPRLYGRDDGWQEMQIWGMGIASHDLTGDGMPEVYLTSQGDNKLQTLAGDPDRPVYEDIALQSGANAHRPFSGDASRPSTAWHAEFDDVNNDGFMDLFVTKGNVDAMPEFAAEDPNNLLLGQPDGTFVEGADRAGLMDLARSRGGAVTDFDLDGKLDVVVVDRREKVKLWRNTGDGMGNWLAVGLEQEGLNRDAIGSWVQVRLGDHVIEREVTVGGGHAGGEVGPVHFGLGQAPTAEIRVQWPNGEVSNWRSVPANQRITITP